MLGRDRTPRQQNPRMCFTIAHELPDLLIHLNSRSLGLSRSLPFRHDDALAVSSPNPTHPTPVPRKGYCRTKATTPTPPTHPTNPKQTPRNTRNRHETLNTKSWLPTWDPIASSSAHCAAPVACASIHRTWSRAFAKLSSRFVCRVEKLLTRASIKGATAAVQQ